MIKCSLKEILDFEYVFICLENLARLQITFHVTENCMYPTFNVL